MVWKAIARKKDSGDREICLILLSNKEWGESLLNVVSLIVNGDLYCCVIVRICRR